MIANPPAIPPARAACHLRVCFLTRINWARVVKESRFPPDITEESRGCASSLSKVEADEICFGFIAGIKMGRALIRNLYKEVNVPK